MKTSILYAAFLASVVAVLLSSSLANADRFGCQIIINPENPTESDEVNASVNFLFRTSPPFVIDFGSITQNGNTYSVNVTILIPDKDWAVLQVIHLDNQTYPLGKLKAGDYRFEVYGKAQGNVQPWLEQEAEFTVGPSLRTLPEFPASACFLILPLLAAACALVTRKTARKKTTKPRLQKRFALCSKEQTERKTTTCRVVCSR